MAVPATEESPAVDSQPIRNIPASWEFSPTETPVFNDLPKFVLIRDTSGNRTYTYSDVKSNLLVSWRDKSSLYLYVHVYSLSIINNPSFKDMKKKLLDPSHADRAGAATEETRREMVL